MTKLLFTQIFLFLSLFSHAQHQPEALQFLEKAVAQIKKFKSGEYEISSVQNSIFGVDTFHFQGSCSFKKHFFADTVLYSIQTKDSTSKSEHLYYQRDSTHFGVSHSDSTIFAWEGCSRFDLVDDRTVFKPLVIEGYLEMRLPWVDSLWLEYDAVQQVTILCYFKKENEPGSQFKEKNDLTKIYFNSQGLPFRETSNFELPDYGKNPFQDIEIRFLKHTNPKPRIDKVYVKKGYKYVDGAKWQAEWQNKQQAKSIKEGAILPNWKLEGYNGDSIELHSIKGKLILLDFWYKACLPCILSMPMLEQLHEKYGNKGLVVIGINPYDEDIKNTVDFMKKRNMKHPSVYAPDIPALYGFTAFPTFVFLDENYKILRIQIGFGEDETETDFKEWIRKYLKLKD